MPDHPRFLAVLLLLLWIPCAIGGALGLRKLGKTYPEVREFRHVGLASLLTFGLPLLGLFPYLLLEAGNLKSDSFLDKWLARPVTLWGVCFAAEFILGVFAPHKFSDISSHLLVRAMSGVFLYMLIVSWKAPDVLARFSARKELHSILWALAVVICFTMLSSGSLWCVVGFIGIWPSLSFASSAYVQHVMATLTVATRHSTRPRERVWLLLLGSGTLVVGLGYLAPVLHLLLARLPH